MKSPSGVVGFVSELYPGSTTDKEITVKSGFLKMLEQGDEVMADKVSSFKMSWLGLVQPLQYLHF